MIDWGKVIVFIIGVLVGAWLTATTDPTIEECIPICSQMIE